jgi:hypothetical protein
MDYDVQTEEFINEELLAFLEGEDGTTPATFTVVVAGDDLPF